MKCGLYTGKFDIILSNKKQQIEYNNIIDDFLFFSKKLSVPFLLDLNKTTYSFIEKIIYDNIKFHSNRLNIDLSNRVVSFWSKTTEYNFNYTHMHIDHCDYESRMFNTEIKKPLFTSVLYFNDNDCPTLLTDVTREMNNKIDFLNINNTKLGFSFPNTFKNIVFNSGNYYHGECYLKEYKQKERKVIVIAVWDKKDEPSYLSYFNNELLNSFLFSFFERPIHNTVNIVKYDKITTLLIVKETTNNIINIKINNSQLINNSFFVDLLVYKKKDVIYRFNQIFEKFKNLDTFVLDFSNII